MIGNKCKKAPKTAKTQPNNVKILQYPSKKTAQNTTHKQIQPQNTQIQRAYSP
jgi:hypothetical protein